MARLIVNYLLGITATALFLSTIGLILFAAD